VKRVTNSVMNNFYLSTQHPEPQYDILVETADILHCYPDLFVFMSKDFK
jgi:hypothetical protein